jgi:hypothetical protein
MYVTVFFDSFFNGRRKAGRRRYTSALAGVASHIAGEFPLCEVWSRGVFGGDSQNVR